MIQIDVGDHTGIENGTPFMPIPTGFLPQVKWAGNMALSIAIRRSSANRYFVTLPRGRTLTQLVKDGTIWINYVPSLREAL